MYTRIGLLMLAALGSNPATAATDYFAIRVVDEQTDRGVPLVELRTVHAVRYYTDSAGLVAFNEPGLMDQEVFFFVSSHGYEYPADGFGMRGVRLKVQAGGEATVRIRRVNIAERLYRITGGGIYRDSVLLGRPAPIREPVLNGLVIGQDSVQTAVYQGKLYWFWGDTSWPRYPLGNFHMAGATSLLPSAGRLDPAVGVDLDYFVRDDGFAREMAPHPEPGPVWLDSFVTLPDESGRERMYAAYARVTASMEAVERGHMCYDDDQQVFKKVAEFDVNAPARPGGHPFTCRDDDERYIYFPAPFPLVRVRANARAYLDLGHYESWTPLKPGSRLDAPLIDRDAAGRIRYAWRSNTPALEQSHQNDLVEAGKLKPEETWVQLQDADTGKAVIAHAGSVYWNDHRQRWITIRCEVMGTSMLGETWYAEADTPLGPWVYARKIVTHDNYSFYNPRQHPAFDQDNGRVIFFEGTYVNTFSGNADKTPRYDYNQVMYRLNLADPRLALPVPVYRQVGQSGTAGWRTAGAAEPARTDSAIAFFALDRSKPGTVPIFVGQSPDGCVTMRLGPPRAAVNGEPVDPCFHALPANTQPQPETCVPLFEYTGENGRREYLADQDLAKPGFKRAEKPLCLVWRNPIQVPVNWMNMRRRAIAE